MKNIKYDIYKKNKIKNRITFFDGYYYFTNTMFLEYLVQEMKKAIEL